MPKPRSTCRCRKSRPSPSAGDSGANSNPYRFWRHRGQPGGCRGPGHGNPRSFADCRAQHGTLDVSGKAGCFRRAGQYVSNYKRILKPCLFALCREIGNAHVIPSDSALPLNVRNGLLNEAAARQSCPCYDFPRAVACYSQSLNDGLTQHYLSQHEIAAVQ